MSNYNRVLTTTTLHWSEHVPLQCTILDSTYMHSVSKTKCMQFSVKLYVTIFSFGI